VNFKTLAICTLNIGRISKTESSVTHGRLRSGAAELHELKNATAAGYTESAVTMAEYLRPSSRRKGENRRDFNQTRYPTRAENEHPILRS
jgi:hypothetical protein